MTDEQRATMMAAVKRAVDQAGGKDALAELAGVSARTVYRWCAGEVKIRAHLVPTLSDVTGIAEHEFRPDIFRR